MLEFYGLRFARIAPLWLVLLAVLSALHFFGTPGFVVGEETALMVPRVAFGGVVERYYSEPMNRRLRRRFDVGGVARY